MNRIKCSACGFVAFSSDEVCKRCKQNLLEPAAGFNPDSNAYPDSYSNNYSNSNSPSAAYVSPYRTEPEKSISWGSVLFGLLLIGVSFFLYSTFDDLERNGGSVRMNVIVIALYNIGGKWLASIVVAVIGIVVTIAGFSGSADSEN